jgi:hypothetical protein
MFLIKTTLLHRRFIEVIQLIANLKIDLILENSNGITSLLKITRIELEVCDTFAVKTPAIEANKRLFIPGIYIIKTAEFIELQNTMLKQN